MQRTTVKTEDLFLMLQKTDDPLNNWSELKQNMTSPTFCEYLEELLSARGIDTAKFGVMALIIRSFAYQILSGTRVPSREILLRIATAVGLSVDETQHLLRLGDRGALYPKVERDGAIISCLMRGYDLFKTDEFLRKLGLNPLL